MKPHTSWIINLYCPLFNSAYLHFIFVLMNLCADCLYPPTMQVDPFWSGKSGPVR